MAARKAITFLGYGIVWDAENNQPLCEFVEGKYTTSEAREIKILSGIDTIQKEE